jgi:hypothetical protein
MYLGFNSDEFHGNYFASQLLILLLRNYFVPQLLLLLNLLIYCLCAMRCFPAISAFIERLVRLTQLFENVRNNHDPQPQVHNHSGTFPTNIIGLFRIAYFLAYTK